MHVGPPPSAAGRGGPRPYIKLARSGIAQLIEKQREVLAPLLTRVDNMARERLNRKFR